MEPALLEKLICIKCNNGALEEREGGLICLACGQTIPLQGGVPDFLSVFTIGQINWKEDSALDYEHGISRFHPYRLRRIDEPLLRDVQGDVLEIGCGTCRLAKEVEGRQGRYFGLDPVFSFLRYAHNHHHLNLLVRGQGERMPFRDEAFDYLISGFYAYRYVNPDLGLREARRVLKPGGKFTFDILNYWLLGLMELKKAIKAFDLKPLNYRKQGSRFFEFINHADLKRKANNAGFLVEDIFSSPVTPIFPKFNKYLSNLYFHNKMVYLGYDVIVVLRAS